MPRLTLSPIKQILDLNGQSVNFSVEFTIKSVNKQPFEAAVMTQKDLDSGKPIEYRKIVSEPFETGGTVTNSKGVYENYILILRSEKESVCDVLFRKTELTGLDNRNDQIAHSRPTNDDDNKKNDNFYYWIKIGGGMILLGILLYFAYMNREKIMAMISPTKLPPITTAMSTVNRSKLSMLDTSV